MIVRGSAFVRDQKINVNFSGQNFARTLRVKPFESWTSAPKTVDVQNMVFFFVLWPR